MYGSIVIAIRYLEHLYSAIIVLRCNHLFSPFLEFLYPGINLYMFLLFPEFHRIQNILDIYNDVSQRLGSKIKIYSRKSSTYYFILFPLMTVRNLLTLCPNLYPNLVALAALNIFSVILMNLRGKRIGIKAVIDTSSQ
jgi:hypothetical protein